MFRPVRTGPNSRQFILREDSNDKGFTKATLAALNGVPETIQNQRKAIIRKMTRSPTQSGRAKAADWKLFFDKQESWASPLMGWTGGNDPLQAQTLQFPTLQSAIDYAKANGT
jgi:hypothetical protein